ncbi:DUF4321 domain-containing protein [Clostridium sporogenes]|uniref:DUF4321 domain-containing protein n=1 Tax=Clostridium sporogenes TaxID=1509 RepID=UPI0013D1409C|nr:DUF4321 domain-containing protein [Clostridium sporogenes]NFV12682.1 DUF4321 domain-containing protein [Clostridium sporogenes]
MKSPDKNKSLLGVFILLGAILGSIAGEILGSSFTKLSFLKTAYKVGTTSPFNLDLKVFNLAIGLNFDINIMTITGIVLAIILYRK